MVATWWTAWCAVTNSNPWTGSYWSPAQTRPRLLRGSLALRGAAGPRAGADAPRHAPPSRDRPFARRRRGPLASPSSGSPGPRARTGAPTPQASALCGPTRRSAAGTPARTADGSSASWTLLSAPTIGCPRNRVNSKVSLAESVSSQQTGTVDVQTFTLGLAAYYQVARYTNLFAGYTFFRQRTGGSSSVQ